MYNTKDSLIKAYNSLEIIVFDTETTGLKPATDSIIELAAKKYAIKDRKLIEIDRLHLYIKPPFLISEFISDLTGITNDFLKDKESFETLLPSIVKFFGTESVLVGYNVDFDISFMESAFKRSGCEFAYQSKIDVLAMARECYRKTEVPNHKLGTMASHLGVEDGLVFHTAIDDVEATKRVFEVLSDKYFNATFTAHAKLLPAINRIARWEKKDFARIYVDTNMGSFFYDLVYNKWRSKSGSLSDIDMESFENEVFKITNSRTREDFKRFQGWRQFN